jgi:NAD+ synthase (glutamine-hydrolysing)
MAQLNLHVGDIEGNVGRIISASLQARDEFNADLVVFPELAITGYPPEDLLLRPDLYLRVLRGMEEIKRQVSGIDLIVGYPSQEIGGTYNAASLVRDGRIIATYHKEHLPNYSVFDEKRYFVPGDTPVVVDIRGIPVGITICEDIWMPGPMQQAVEAGARLLVNINASPFHINKAFEREGVLGTRARENSIPIIYVNLVGGQDELVFDGASLAMDANGEVGLNAPAFEEALVPVDMEMHNGQVSIKPGDELEFHTDEENIYRALVLGVRDYIDKNGFSGVVIGLSGGVDSALTLAIAVDALGSDRVEAVLMPSRYTADMSIEDATTEAKALGVEFRIIPIESPFQSFINILESEFSGYDTDVTEENIQARCRGIILMAIANKKRKIVLTTGNKSEMAVGYATLYGDMAGGFDVLKDVPKTMVYRLAQYRNRTDDVIPQRVLERPPSAELAPDQKDSDSLPPYEVLDPILEMYVEQDKSLEEIVAEGYDKAVVHRVIALVDRNEYKRRQAPPGVRITRRAFGRDRRYPITSGFGSGKG